VSTFEQQGVAEGLRGTGNPGMPTPYDQGRDDAKKGRAYDNPYDQPGEEQEHSQYKKGYEQGKKQGVAEGDVVQFPKKHKGDITDIHDCPKCGGDLQGGKYMGHAVQVCMPCKQVYLPPNSGIDQQGNKIKEEIVAEKIKGADGKACWKGKRYAGTENGKDKCVPVKESKSNILKGLMG
jgi:hypothetical protein